MSDVEMPGRRDVAEGLKPATDRVAGDQEPGILFHWTARKARCLLLHRLLLRFLTKHTNPSTVTECVHPYEEGRYLYGVTSGSFAY
jgi:hypothetical protein